MAETNSGVGGYKESPRKIEYLTLSVGVRFFFRG